jgi:hypothetical protein
MGSRTGLDAMDKRIIACPCRESDAGSSIVQPIAGQWITFYSFFNILVHLLVSVVE